MTPRFVGYTFAVLFSVAVHAVWIGAAITVYHGAQSGSEMAVANPGVVLG